MEEVEHVQMEKLTHLKIFENTVQEKLSIIMAKKDTTATQFDKIFTITQNEHKIPLQQFYNKLHDQGNRCLRFIFFYIDLKLSVESKFVKKYHL